MLDKLNPGKDRAYHKNRCLGWDSNPPVQKSGSSTTTPTGQSNLVYLSILITSKEDDFIYFERYCFFRVTSSLSILMKKVNWLLRIVGAVLCLEPVQYSSVEYHLNLTRHTRTAR